MSRMPGRSTIAPMMALAMATRMFWGMSIDMHSALNAKWICPLIGLILFCPFAFLIRQFEKIDNQSPMENLASSVPAWMNAFFSLLFAAILVWDAAATMRISASTSNVIALDSETISTLSIPLALSAFAVAFLGAETEGNSARIWLKFLVLLFAIILIVEVGSYRIGWMMPIWGGGIGALIEGGLYCAGCMSACGLFWMMAVPDRNKRSMMRYACFAAVAAATLLLTQVWLCPVQLKSSTTRAAYIELLLSNGRLRVSPHLLVNVVWFGSLLHLLASEIAAAAAFLERLFPKLGRWFPPLLCAGICYGVCIWNPKLMTDYLQKVGILFIAIGGMLVLLACAAIARKDVRRT